MRVTNAATYRKFNTSVNSVHSKLNKSMNKISSGKLYESAAENPSAYFEGKKMDNQYQDTESKLSLISDLKNRLYQQEAGARSIQETLSQAKLKVEYIRNGTNNGEVDNVEIIENDLLQKMHTMVNDLNAQYQDFFIYGGNDLSTAPFELSDDGMTLTYNHVFPENRNKPDNVISIELKMNSMGTFEFSDDDLENLKKAMSEQGLVDTGYGTLRDQSTLLDTYTGGLNLLTGLTSDYIKSKSSDTTDALNDEIMTRLDESPIGLVGRAICAMKNYRENGNAAHFDAEMADIMDKMTQTEHNVSTVYSDLGNKYSLLETTETKLNDVSDLLEEQYQEKLGADPYEAITEMYSHQYAYNASLQLGSSLMQSSLFDFMR